MKLYILFILFTYIAYANDFDVPQFATEDVGLASSLITKNKPTRVPPNSGLVFFADGIGTINNLSITTSLVDSGTLSVTKNSRLAKVNTSSLFVSGNETVSDNVTVSGSYTPTNIDLVDSTATKGLFTKRSTRFITNFGTNNTFIGKSASNLNLRTENAIKNTGLDTSTLAGPTGNARDNARSKIAIGTNARGTLTTGSKLKNTVKKSLIQIISLENQQ